MSWWDDVVDDDDNDGDDCASGLLLLALVSLSVIDGVLYVTGDGFNCGVSGDDDCCGERRGCKVGDVGRPPFPF